MITVTAAVNNSDMSVTLTAATTGSTVTFAVAIGQDFEKSIAVNVPVVNGIATFTDTLAAQKVLLNYVGITDTFERSKPVSCVVPTTYSLSRPTLNADISLSDLVLNTIDADGIVWTCTDIIGYWNLPDVQLPVSDRPPTEDGSYFDDGRYLGRKLTLTGMFLPPSTDMIPTARTKLGAAFQAVRSTTELRVYENPPRRLFVRSAGKSDITTSQQSGLSTFSVELFAADPFKYSIDPMTQPAPADALPFHATAGTPGGGRSYPRAYSVDINSTPGTQLDDVRQYGPLGSPNLCQIYNAGEYPTAPKITIWGPASNPTVQLVETGEYLSFTTTIQAGEFLEVDVKEKTVLLNGMMSRRGAMTFDSTWFTLAPGTSTIRFTAQSSTSSSSGVDIEAYSAWL